MNNPFIVGSYFVTCFIASFICKLYIGSKRNINRIFIAVYSELNKKKLQCTMVSPAEFINKHAFCETRKKNGSELSKNNKSQYYALAHQKQRFIYTFIYYM